MILELRGRIASVAFVSGDRVVTGSWHSGPLGTMNDVMWVRPDNTRVLLAPTRQVAEFVSAIYQFDEVQVEDVRVERSRHRFTVTAGALQVSLELGRRVPIPLSALRLPVVTRFIERPIAKRLLGVHTWGVTKSGVEEWYRASSITFVRSATATVNRVALGAMTDVTPLKVGVSEPPRRPSVVEVCTRLRDHRGVLQ